MTPGDGGPATGSPAGAGGCLNPGLVAAASHDPVRPVRLVAAGGTIAMRGERAVPQDDAAALVAALPALAVAGLEAESVRSVPGVQLCLDDALAVARAARAAAGAGRGVVVTSGTDTIEELALLCDLVHDGAEPIVVTGAIRPGSAAGADGPANLLDAVAVAGSAAAAGLGAVVVFGGEIHAARFVRKGDSTGPTAFTSPLTGPIGRVGEGRTAVLARPPRRPALAVERFDARVGVVAVGIGDDGWLVRAALAAGADGLVVVAMGAGHLPPPVLEAVEEAAARLPVVACVRPERGQMLRGTYGFRGSEGDLRASGAIPAPILSPAAARLKLVACLGAGLRAAALREVFRDDDP